MMWGGGQSDQKKLPSKSPALLGLSANNDFRKDFSAHHCLLLMKEKWEK